MDEDVEPSEKKKQKLSHCGNVGPAIIEILAFILKQSFRCPETLVLGVQVRSTTKTLDALTWFYIKVWTSTVIKIEDFNGARFGSLHELLSRMQSRELESHLCFQHPRTDDQQGSTQENLILEGQKLSVQDVQHKSKNTKYYTLYLRVQLETWQMTEACADIHNFMVLARIFRPNEDLSFSMKIGEIVTDTVFRYRTCQKVSSKLPEIVTDSKFYSKKGVSGLRRSLAVSSNISTGTVHGYIQRQAHGSIQNVDIELVCLCCQYVKAEGDHGKPSSISITVFGSGYVPCACKLPQLEDLLTTIDWGQYYMKLSVTDRSLKPTKGHFHGVLHHRKSSHMDRVHLETFIVIKTDSYSDESVIQQALTDSLNEVRRKLGEVINEVLQPYLTKAKTRSMLQRSIQSVCKAVTDVVSMSSSDVFRSKALDIMKVSDTQDLGEKLDSALRKISSKYHHGVFPGNTAEVTNDSQHFVSGHDQIVPAVSTTQVTENRNKGSETCTQNEELDGDNDKTVRQDQTLPTEICGARSSAEVDYHTLNLIDGDRSRSLSQVKHHQTEIYRAKPSAAVDDLALNPIDSDRSLSEVKHHQVAVSPFHELAVRDEEDKTPEITQLTKCFKEVSPFQELGATGGHGIEGILNENPFSKDYNGLLPCSTKTKTKGMKDDIASNNSENIEAKGENADNQHFLLLSQCFPNPHLSGTSKPGLFWERVNSSLHVSPFHEAINEEKNVNEDKTPEITQLTKSFKEVSPFQELAVTDMNPEEELLHEDPFKESVSQAIKIKDGSISSQGPQLSKDEVIDITRKSSENLCNYSVFHSRVQDQFEHTENTVNTEVGLYEETHVKQSEQQIDCLDQDSEDWFNDVLMGVDHWLK